MGIRIQVENFGDKERSIRYSFVDKYYTYALHMHQFIELFVLLEGELEITVDGKSEIMKPGQGAVILPYQSHKYYSKVKNKAAIFLFSQASMPDFYRAIHGKLADEFVFSLEESSLDSLQKRILNSKSISMYDLKGALYYILGDFLKQSTLVSAPKKANLPSGIMNYIIDHIAENISLVALAKSLGYTPHYLSGVINNLFNMNFSKFLCIYYIIFTEFVNRIIHRFLCLDTQKLLKNCIYVLKN